MSPFSYLSALLAPYLECLAAAVLCGALRFLYVKAGGGRLAVALVGSMLLFAGTLTKLPDASGSPSAVPDTSALTIARTWLPPIGLAIAAIGLFGFASGGPPNNRWRGP